MIIQSCEKFNKGQFAKSNVNTGIFNICNTSTSIQIRTASKTQTTTTTKCSAQKESRELPKEFLSTVTLTTHLLPTTVAAANTHLFREPKNVFNSCGDDSENINNRSKKNYKKCCNCKSLSSFGDSSPFNSKGKLHQEPLQLLPPMKYLPLMSTTTEIESIYSPTYKFRHRKNICREISVNNNISKISGVNNTQQNNQNMMTTLIKTNRLLVLAEKNNKKNVTTKRLRKKSSPTAMKSIRFRPLSGLKVTSLFSLLTLVCLETVLLSTVSNCAKTFYMHWNTSNSIFRIDNTDHIIDVNKGNLAFEFDQVHIICPVYEPGTFENETEKYIIYNVSKVEYETCRITNADPRVIAVCDKPQKLMFFTITFRPFTPQPGGLEFLPGNDYYFISTSSKDDLYRRIGGRCSTNNMKVVFKVCCASEDKNNKTLSGGNSGGSLNSASNANAIGTGGGGGTSKGIVDSINTNGSGGSNMATGGTVNQQHINIISTGLVPGSGNNINNGVGNGVQLKTSIGGSSVGTSGTSINTNIDQFNRIPIQANGISGISNDGIGGIGLGSHGSNGILLTPGGTHGLLPGTSSSGGVNINGQYPSHQQTGIRVNNVPSQQHPSHKNNNDDLYNKHPNEVVKNEELTYNSAGTTLHHRCRWTFLSDLFKSAYIDTILASISTAFNGIDQFKSINTIVYKKFTEEDIVFKLKRLFSFNINPIIIISILLVMFSTYIFQFRLYTRSSSSLPSTCNVSLRKSTKSSYLPILSSNCSTSLRSGNEKCTNKISNTAIRSKYIIVKSNKEHNLKNAYQNPR